MEYAHTVWDPIYAEHASKLDFVQRRAARYVTGRYRRRSSVKQMLNTLEWPDLAARREHARLVMFYKIHYNLVATPMPLSLKGHPEPTRHENTLAYRIPTVPQNYYSESFFLRTAEVWNTLPEATVRADTLAAYKSVLPFPN